MDMKPIFKMIDFSNSDGELFLSIQYETNEEYSICLVNREDDKNRKTLKGRGYGNYVEVSENIIDIFPEDEVRDAQVWDVYALKGKELIEIDLNIHKNFMVDYFKYENIRFKIKPYITATDTLAIFIKEK